MYIEELLHNTSNPYSCIKTECGGFLTEAASFPFFRLLPKTYDNIHKVKIRLQKKQNAFTETFNETFKFANLRQRAIFTTSHILEETETTEPFYVFPIDGYKFLYSKEVRNSNTDFKNAFDVILDSFNTENEATGLVKDLLRYTYVSDNLNEAVEHEAEVIFYNIPFYYAVRSNSISYEDLLTSVL